MRRLLALGLLLCSAYYVYGQATGSGTFVASGGVVISSAPGTQAPSITQQPQNTEVPVGQTATFTVVATNATTYQWQKNGSNVGGATSSSFTTPVTVSGDNGSTWDVVINGGALTSVVVTLQVDTAASIATATVTPTATTNIPSNFGGISTFSLPDNCDMMGTAAAPNPIYRQLIKNLIFPGQSFILTAEDDDSPSGGAIPSPGPTAAQVGCPGQLFTDMNNAGYNFTYWNGVPECAGSQTHANQYASAFLNNMPATWLPKMVFGNEPDITASGCGGYTTYNTRFGTWSTGIRALTGGANTLFMGPELAATGSANATSFINANFALLSAGGEHGYPMAGGSCTGNLGTATIPLELAAGTASYFNSALATAISAAHAKGTKLFLSETNTAFCSGVDGVSNVQAAGLWLMDYMFNLASVGVDSVEVFSDEGDFYDLFGFTTTSAPYSISFINPEYYGFMMFQQATQNNSSIIGDTVTSSNNVASWATRDAASVVRILMINKDQSATGTAQITLAGYQTATATYLKAPLLTSKTGITYAGQTFDGSSDGTLQGAVQTWQVPAFSNVYQVQLPVASAVLLTLIPAFQGPLGLNTAPGWVKIPGTTLNGGSENHTPCPPNGFRSWTMSSGDWTANCHNVFLDPSGGIMDWPRNRMCIWGGGHNDYGGNEIYCLQLALAGKDINGHPFVAGANTYGPLVRMDNPGPPNTSAIVAAETLPAATSLPQAGFGPGNAFPDPTRATPNARHLYDGVEFLPSLDLEVIVNGNLNATGGSGNHTWKLGLSSLNYATCAPQLFPSAPCDPNWLDAGNTVPSAGAGTILKYDPKNGKLWIFENLTGVVYQNDPTTFGGWTSAGSFGAVLGFHSSSVMDPDDDFWIHVGNNPPTDGMGYFDLGPFTANGSNPVHHAPTLDATCTNMMSAMLTNKKYYPGLVWDPIAKQVVIYPGFGNNLYFLDPKQTNWVCISEAFGATQGVDYPQDSFTTSGAEGGEGTFTKFNYSPSLDVFEICNDYNKDCWYFHRRRGNFTIKNTSGGTLTNQPRSQGLILRDGDVKQCANVFLSVNGVMTAVATTQTDVKNRYPSGNLKYAVVSFIVPGSWAASEIKYGDVDSQASCNNSSPQTKTQMLAAGYNFDAKIVLTATFNRTISARSILNAATNCTDPGTDFEGSSSLCTYWLKGPIVTAVLLADRQGKTFDTNVDGNAGNPLHPEFEAWFYPQNNAVQIGVSLENIWASTTPANSARNQTYAAAITTGNTSPTTVLSQASGKHQTRTRWHRTFWLNQADPVSLMMIDYNYRYLATTKFFPNWDPFNPVTPTTLAAGANPVRCTPSFFATESLGLFNVNTTGDSVGCIPVAIAATGANEYHGALPTWAIACLMTQDPGYCKVDHGDGAGNPGHAELINELPYFFREADASAGHGGFYDVGGTIGTLGRNISINARTQVSLNSTASANTCNTNFAADYINFGGTGEDITPWGANNLDTTHEGNGAYLAYLMTGQHFYYETVLMQGAYALGLGPGNRACTQNSGNANLRMGSAGYYYNDQERGQTWIFRDNGLAAFIAVDGSPEKGYFEDKLKQNISVFQCARGMTNDYPANSTACTYGSTARNLVHLGNGSSLGSWTLGQGYAEGAGSNYVIASGSTLNQVACDGAHATTPCSANAWFQNEYSAEVTAWIHDLGYNPSDNLRGWIANFFLNRVMNPANTIFDIGVYVYPTADNNNVQTNITTWAQFNTFFNTHASSWPTCNVGVDEGHQDTQGVVSLYYDLTSSQGGYKGSDAFNTLVASMNCNFTNGSPKWDLVPRGQYGLSVSPIPAKTF